MNELALFAGAGGGILAGEMLGWRTVCAVEWEPYPASVLIARQNDKVLPAFPIWDDVQTFDGKPWRGIVDVVSGGFPCQDISAAGKGAGIDGERSGMWREMARIIREVRPRFAFVENSPMLTSRGLGTVLGDLAAMGFDARWGVLGAADVGANHQRDRIWIVATNVADTNSYRFDKRETHRGRDGLPRQIWETEAKDGRRSISIDGLGKTSSVLADTNNARLRSRGRGYGIESDRQSATRDINEATSRIDVELEAARESSHLEKEISHTNCTQLQRNSVSIGIQAQHPYAWDSRWWETEPDVGRVANGVDAGVDRLKALGNGQVPLCAATAWQILSQA